MMTIYNLDLRRLKNAEHVQFHTNIRNIINTAGIEEIGLSELLYNPYHAAILKEQDIVNKAVGSPFTIEMQAADAQRDLIFKRIRKKLETCELENPVSVAYKATPIVKKHFLTKYGYSVITLPYQEETATLTGLILDAHTLLTSEQIEDIGIDSDLEELQEANAQFNAMYHERVGEKAENDAQLSLRLRAATDEAYTLMTLNLNYLANDPTPANQSKVDACHAAVAKLNVVIKEAKDRLNQRLKLNGADSTEDADGGADADEGKDNGGTNQGSADSTKPSSPSTSDDDDDMMG